MVLDVIFGFILRNSIKPRCWIIRNALMTPGLHGREERVARDVFRNFDVSNTKSAHEHRYNFLVFRAEQIWYQIVSTISHILAALGSDGLPYLHIATDVEHRTTLRDLSGLIVV